MGEELKTCPFCGGEAVRPFNGKLVACQNPQCPLCNRAIDEFYWNRRQEGKPRTWRDVLTNIPQCPQRQDSTDEQLADLRLVANRLGFYDAADYLRPPHRQEANPLTGAHCGCCGKWMPGENCDDNGGWGICTECAGLPPMPSQEAIEEDLRNGWDASPTSCDFAEERIIQAQADAIMTLWRKV